VCKSSNKSSGPILHEATAIEGSTKCLVVLVRIAVTERKFGFQASNSLITNISFNALNLLAIDSTSRDRDPFAIISSLIRVIFPEEPIIREYERSRLRTFVRLRGIWSMLETSDLIMS